MKGLIFVVIIGLIINLLIYLWKKNVRKKDKKFFDDLEEIKKKNETD